MIFGMNWFTMFNPAINWANHMVTMTLDASDHVQRTSKPASASQLVELCDAQTFQQTLPHSHAFAIRVDAVDELTLDSMLLAGPDHPILSSWLSCIAPHLSLSTCYEGMKWALTAGQSAVPA